MQMQVLGIVGVLGGALYVQFVGGEFPCPLCLLQRMAMMLAAMGPMYVLLQREGDVHSVPSHDRFMRGYGISILAAVLGIAIASRQVLLHIEPGDPGYGTPVLGWHLYTWAVVVFATVIMVSGLTMFFSRTLLPRDLPGSRSKATRATAVVFGVVILVNVISTFAESGLRIFVPDNPTQYELIEDIESRVSSSE
ncbi:MAG: disulfide bond formation protein B [Phycisphaera sp.]|nr:disulfide bond formation protein B [Phycisphaera sp.]